jgi:NAD(P)-dependent dehydrogenase (short-subunit alcohol dehydrogenase family)
VTHANNLWNPSEEEEELREEIPATGDKADEGDEEGNEEDVEVFRKMIDAVENHDGDIDLLYSGAGMYLLGMTFGWTAFRVAHTRTAALNYKKILGITTHSLAFPYGGHEGAP